MNPATPSLAKTEIIKQLGYFPAFLTPAINSSLIYQSLVQQTLFAYVNNPFPSQFKEKLFVVLSRYFGIDYFTICHSCTLRSQGVSATEILRLAEFQYPDSELEVAMDLEVLREQWGNGMSWQDNSNLEESLLRCSSLLFLQTEHTANLSTALKELLGTVYYHYLVIFLGYIKLCHQWLRCNQNIEHYQDRRSQLRLGSLLLEEIKLAQFFTTKRKIEASPLIPLTVNQFSGGSSQDNLATAIANQPLAEVSLPQLRQKTLTTCLANAPFPVMIHNQQGEIIHLNRNWLEASGYELREISTINEWNRKAQIRQRDIVKLPFKNSSHLYRKYVAPAHQTGIEATTALQQIVNSLIEIAPEVHKTKIKAEKKLADAIRSEVTIATKNGEQLYWELYSTALSFESETDELVISIAKDITDVVHNEAKLAEVEAKLRLVLEATKTGNWSWNLTTNQVDVCHRGRTILGLDDFDGSYESFLRSINPAEREAVDLEIAKAIQAHQELDVKYSVVKANQEVVQVQTKGKLNYSAKGKAIRLSGVVIDITSTPEDLSAQNQKLSLATDEGLEYISTDELIISAHKSQSLRELRTIIDLLPYFLLVVDAKSQEISLMNSELANSLNLAKEQTTIKTIAECFSIEYAQQIDWQHQQVITYKQVLRVQEEVTLPDGIHYFDTVVTPLYDDQENIYALLRTSSNIPDLAATQEALSQRTIQLEAANRELESFSYSVSHDLQAPLRVINGFSEVLWENYQTNLDDRAKHYLRRIQANSKRMSDLIDALLELSRVTRSQMKPVKVNLSNIAQDIIEELQGEHPERQIEVKIAPALETTGDPQLLRIALSNLFHNAWKYTSKRSHPRIELGMITEYGAGTTYFVKDNGAGFDQIYADKLFTPFQRLHSQAEFPGTGIGLATVQRIIYRHGGKVWAKGESDRGATIYFSF